MVLVEGEVRVTADAAKAGKEAGATVDGARAGVAAEVTRGVAVATSAGAGAEGAARAGAVVAVTSAGVVSSALPVDAVARADEARAAAARAVPKREEQRERGQSRHSPCLRGKSQRILFQTSQRHLPRELLDHHHVKAQVLEVRLLEVHLLWMTVQRRKSPNGMTKAMVPILFLSG